MQIISPDSRSVARIAFFPGSRSSAIQRNLRRGPEKYSPHYGRKDILIPFWKILRYCKAARYEDASCGRVVNSLLIVGAFSGSPEWVGFVVLLAYHWDIEFPAEALFGLLKGCMDAIVVTPAEAGRRILF